MSHIDSLFLLFPEYPGFKRLRQDPTPVSELDLLILRDLRVFLVGWVIRDICPQFFLCSLCSLLKGICRDFCREGSFQPQGELLSDAVRGLAFLEVFFNLLLDVELARLNEYHLEPFFVFLTRGSSSSEQGLILARLQRAHSIESRVSFDLLRRNWPAPAPCFEK